MPRLVLYDDATARGFEPFACTRPISELAAATRLIRERWQLTIQPNEGIAFAAGDRHADFDEDGSAAAEGVLPRGTVIANARCIPPIPTDILRAGARSAACTMWRCDGRLAAVRLREPLDVADLEDGSKTLDELFAGTGAIGELKGWWVNEVWDFIRHLEAQLKADIAAFGGQPSARYSAAPAHATVIGDSPVFVDGATIEPHVILDTTNGPILIERGAHIHGFTRINGPAYIGRDVNVLGGDISGCAIGPVCKVRGEMSSTIMLGYSNKGHDGFIGHSYLGRWVNIGAGTITSNLKNTYGTVALWTPTGVRDSGMQFLGTMFGDHVKTGIGLRLTTGTVVGACANVYDKMPPKAVSPFSWGGGSPYSTYRIDKFLESAQRMMSRRHVELTDRARRHLTSVFAGRWTAETDDT